MTAAVTPVAASAPDAEGVRLQKVLARAGIGSRRVCEDLIAEARVLVDGEVAVLGRRIDPESAKVTVDGVLVGVAEHLVHYLRELANDFHTYYNAHAFIVDDANLRDARLTLISATRNVIANGLGILGVSAPDKM